MSAIKENFDAVVVGGGLGGLLIATSLDQRGWRVLLVEEREELGGQCRGQELKWGRVEFGLKVVPDTEQIRKDLAFFGSLLGSEAGQHGYVEASPMTHENGKFTSFVGFGSLSPPFVEEIGYYLMERRLDLQASPSTWISTLKELFTGVVLTKHRVTNLLLEEGRLKGILINGVKKIFAKEVIYCGPVKNLLNIVSDEVFAAKNRQKVARSRLWASLSLDLWHSRPISDSQSIHLLRSPKVSGETAIGLFGASKSYEAGEMQTSHWMTWIDEESLLDDESSGASLRAVRRQLKRAFPEIFDHLFFERILVTQESHGLVELKLEGGMRWPQVENLWIGSGQINSHRNLAGVLNQARKVFTSLIERSKESPCVAPEIHANSNPSMTHPPT